jgi:hypothetical protein
MHVHCLYRHPPRLWYISASKPLQSESLQYVALVNASIGFFNIHTRIMQNSEPVKYKGKLPEHPCIFYQSPTSKDCTRTIEFRPESSTTCSRDHQTVVIVHVPPLQKSLLLTHIQARNCHNCWKLVIAGKRCSFCKTQNLRPTSTCVSCFYDQ